MEVSSLYSNFAVTPSAPAAQASAISGSIGTILPQGSQSVAPVAAGSATASTTGRATPSNPPQSKPTDGSGQPATVAQFTRDSSSNALVFVEIDAQTQAVIVQIPDEQILKLRTYIAEMQRREEVAQQITPGSRVAKTT
jgi:type II secretory pathway component GspD/PulD (secretin)